VIKYQLTSFNTTDRSVPVAGCSRLAELGMLLLVAWGRSGKSVATMLDVVAAGSELVSESLSLTVILRGRDFATA
jgi:hypothetical protein